MNVLNKIKSKRNKESSELSQAPQIEVKVEEIFTQQKPAPIIPKSVNVAERQSIMRPLSQRSKSDPSEDLDQATVSQYFLKKDRQNKKAKKNLSQSGQIIKEDQLVSSVTINVKKGYSLGSISIFQGQAITKQQGKQDKRRKMTFSCGSESIQFPEGISKIFLSKITFISEDEAIFVGEDIIKVAEKGYTKK